MDKIAKELTNMAKKVAERRVAKSVDDLLRDNENISNELSRLIPSVKSADVPKGIKRDVIKNISEAKKSLQEATELLSSMTRPTNIKNYIKMLHKGFEGVRVLGGKADSDYDKVVIHGRANYELRWFRIHADKISVGWETRTDANSWEIPFDLKAHITGDIKTDIDFIKKFLRKNW